MEHTRRQNRVRLSLCKCVKKMFHLACTARCYNRYFCIFRNTSCKFNIVSSFRTVTIHTCKQYLACTKLLGFFRPFKRINSGIHTAAVKVHIPTALIFTSFCVNRTDNALSAEFFSRLADKLGTFYRRTVYGNFIRTGIKNFSEIFNCSYSAPYRKRYKHLFRNSLNHIDNRFACIRRRGYVKKNKLVRTGFIINLCTFDRITGVNKIYKIDTFNHSSLFNVKARYNSFCVHIVISLL